MESSRIRLLTREEKTTEVITSYTFDPRIILTRNWGTSKYRVWGAFDYSDSELVEQVFKTYIYNWNFALPIHVFFTEIRTFINACRNILQVSLCSNVVDKCTISIILLCLVLPFWNTWHSISSFRQVRLRYSSIKHHQWRWLTEQLS